MYVVGHLDKKEAEVYWKENILIQNAHCLKNTIAPPKFDEVFEICGGSMYLMDMFFREYCTSNGLIHRDVKNFHVVLQEEQRIRKALTPDRVVTFKDVERPKWTRDILLSLIKMMLTTGTLDYNEVCSKFGEDIIDSMIKYNIVHLRPTSQLAHDVSDHIETRSLQLNLLLHW